MNVLIQDSYFRKWSGGANFISNLTRALRSQRIDLYRLSSDTPNISPKIAYKETVDLRFPQKFSLQRIAFRLDNSRTLLHMNKWLSEIDVCFQIQNEFLKKCRPTVHWIPDFQHVERPDYFTNSEILKRNMEFEHLSKNAKIILLSSNHAQSVYASKHPHFYSKARVVPFVVEIPEEVFSISLLDLKSKYGLPDHYFHFPGQWWLHKNHRLVLEALIRNKKIPPILFTGNQDDYRHPNLKEELQTLVKIAGNRALSLGQIPYLDMLAIMRFSTGVINPSSYEGWSTTVEEAKLLGKKLVLSSIPVHLEQNPQNVNFFNLNEPDSVEDALIKSTGFNAELPSWNEVSVKMEENFLVFGTKLKAVFEEAMK